MSETIKVCPRCGDPYNYVSVEPRRTSSRSGTIRYYVYAVHTLKVGREREVRKCYLGPAGRYIHVNKILNLDLTNPLDLDPGIVVDRLFRLIATMVRAARTKEDKERAAARIRLWRERLESLVKKLELLEREVAP
jgi:hypothetical protein